MNYQIPSDEILEWADADLPPMAHINRKGTHIVFLESKRYLPLEDLFQPEMKLAGMRIHPYYLTHSRSSFYSGFQLKEIGQQGFISIDGLPAHLRIHQIQWSDDDTKVALTLLEEDGLRLWCIDVADRKAFKISDDLLNGVLTTPFMWHPNGTSMIILAKTSLADDLEDPENTIPTGPVISSGNRSISQHRTYQDLLKNPVDEVNFHNLSFSQIKVVTLEGKSDLVTEGMIRSVSISPNGRYLLYSKIKPPFSYHLPASRFPFQVSVMDLDTYAEMVLEDVPLQDKLPQGFMAVHPYRRGFSWRNDKGDTLLYKQALDGGDPGNEVPFRDALYQLKPPFGENIGPDSVEILKSVNRMNYVLFSDQGFGIASDYWYDTRNSKTYLFYPDIPDSPARIIFDRNVQDYYGDPGSFIMTKNELGRMVIGGHGNTAYLSGQGYGSDGVQPFIDRYDIETGHRDRVWQAENRDELVRLAGVLDLESQSLIIRRESSSEFPNYYKINWDNPMDRETLTDFQNPFVGMDSIRKEIIHYTRKDGTELHALLYLPDTPPEEEKYPLLMWAYPEEYTNKDLAGQVTTSPHEFIYPWYGSPIFWVRRGYAVLDEVAFPIIGDGEEKSNDTFIEQLRDNASAAIDAVCSHFSVDPRRVAIGGHSYGAFMTANLLTWTNLFAAGIARSGAYNRSLTPFGFQGEQRTLWQAPELYHKMSPFDHADKMKTPLLLIHGQMDNNTGTHTMQSQRYFDALKSLGAEVRLVLLPRESHQYRSRESILHVLWEQDRWLEKYLKN